MQGGGGGGGGSWRIILYTDMDFSVKQVQDVFHQFKQLSEGKRLNLL